jgi:N-acetylglucosaminyl-diphospho-decaprenol L-rhamnosyltransferase
MKVSVIVLSHNTRELTLTCLRQFATEADRAGWQIIVVDNGSHDETTPAVRWTFPQVEVICSQENLGFAAGNNLGLRRAQGQTVILMNSDVLAPFSTLAVLAALLDQYPQVGVLSPQLRTATGMPQAFAYGNDPTLPYLLKRGLYRLLGRGPLHDWGVQSPLEVDWVSGACMCVRRAAFEQVGLLDENFFLYFEDNDWCLRMRKAGWKVMYIPTCAVVHLGGQSWPAAHIAGHHYRNSLRYFYQKHYGPPATWLLTIGLFGYHFLWKTTTVSTRYRKQQ